MAIRVRILSVTAMTADAPQVTIAVELFDLADVTFVNISGSVTLSEPDFTGLNGPQSLTKLASTIDGWATNTKAAYLRSIRLSGAFNALVGADRAVS